MKDYAKAQRTPADKMPNRAAIVSHLVAHAVDRAVAAQYADAYLEYQEANQNILTFGAMVLHPRTANPIENPYLRVRDRALAKLQKMQGRVKGKVDHLWN